MSLSVTVATTLTRIRQEADIETTDQANSICTDAMLLAWLNDAYRALYEIILPRTGKERFAKSATIDHSTGALPSDFLQDIGIDFAPNGITLSARGFQWAERNLLTWRMTPLYRISGGVVVWEPTTQTPTSDYTLWYLPTPATLASGGSFDSIDGWDTYVILWVKRKVLAKQDLPLNDVNGELQETERRIMRSAWRLGGWGRRIQDVRDDFDDYYLNG